MIRALALLAVLALAACQTDPLGRSAAEVRDQQERCEAAGGRFAPGGYQQIMMCFRQTADGGAACTNSTECDGLCMVSDAGGPAQCSAETPVFGCVSILDEIGEEVVLCID